MINIILILTLITGRDTLPPQILGTFPQDSAKISPYYSIYIGFTQEMDSSSFDSSAIEINSSSGKLPKKIDRIKFTKNDSLIIIPVHDYWKPFDTIQVTIKGYVKGKNGLTLDGNGNGIPEGSPIDDYVFEFYTCDYGFSSIPKDNFPFCSSGIENLPLPDPGSLKDINDDNAVEIIYTWLVQGGIKLGVIDKNAQLLPNFPVYIEGRWSNGLLPCAIADLNRDGYFEIIPNVAPQSNLHTLKFYIFSQNGSLFPGWPQTYEHDSVVGAPLHSTVSCYDLDDDGELEIIFPVRPHYIFIFEKNGELWNNTPLRIPKGWLLTGMAIGDLNNDAIPEMIFVSGTASSLPDTTFINVLEPDGSVFPNFPKEFPNVVGGEKPVLGDINNDSFPEIIFLGISCYLPLTGYIWAIDRNGNILDGFPIEIQDENFFNAISLGDIDGDSVPEIIAVTGGEDWIPDLLVIKGNGTPLTGFPVEVPGFNVLYPPAVADVDNDGCGEIFVTSSGAEEIPIPGFFNVYEPRTYVTLFSQDGNIIAGFPVIIPEFTNNSPLISDIENDGYIDFILSGHSIIIYSFTTPFESYNTILYWSLPYHDIHNTSNYHYVPPEISISELASNYKHLFNFSAPSIVRNKFEFRLSLPEGLKDKKLKILFYSPDGRKIKEFKMGKSYGIFKNTIDMSNFKRGIYFYKLKIDNAEFFKGKFIKL